MKFSNQNNDEDTMKLSTLLASLKDSFFSTVIHGSWPYLMEYNPPLFISHITVQVESEKSWAKAHSQSDQITKH